MSGATQSELLSVSLELWHPNCWALQVTDDVDAELIAYGALTEGHLARKRYVVSGDAKEEPDRTIEQIRESSLTHSVADIGSATEGPAIGRRSREIYVEFEAANSIDSAFTDRGLVYDGPPTMVDGREQWDLLVRATRDEVARALDEIRDERDARITVDRLSPVDSPLAQTVAKRERALSRRQREALALARDRGYYQWPRAVTAQELADELGVSKTTFLEHLRHAESKLIDPD